MLNKKTLNKRKKMKTYYDKRFNTKESSINVGDYVLLRQKPKNKLSTKFNTSGIMCHNYHKNEKF